jgi:hypothetical protein
MRQLTNRNPALQIDKTFIGLGLLCFILFCKVQIMGQRNSNWKGPFTQTEWLFSPKATTSQVLKGNAVLAEMKTATL